MTQKESVGPWLDVKSTPTPEERIPLPSQCYLCAAPCATEAYKS